MHSYTLTAFTPAEVEKITGLSTMMQRDWRRRGFIPVVGGHARFDPFSLAEIFVMKLLADRGIGPIHSRGVAEWCAIGILWNALLWVDAYEGDHLRTFEWYPEDVRQALAAQRSPSAKDEGLLEAVLGAAGIELPKGLGSGWAAKGEYLARQVLRMRGHGRVIPARFFVWWADGTHVWHESLDMAFGGVSNEAKYAGPVIVLDLNAIASTMGERAGRALVHVEFETDAQGNVLSPIEYGDAVALTNPVA
ncbi:hypothetical protein C3941_13660 [Kaistia algarum]|uniref:MerR family transcriptional regulator n=1 Tax=Kaistia algarum TaxID=2083279 RepID=UPI000CE871C0|nr:MerR family transcriptional regulator [Kaistia algarum]MCX5513738.1 MerR family transcriptional regulator [Kaistia algarum]PPE79391.1 hypothetical protein C3941_13660 [Kaistia algarum]